MSGYYQMQRGWRDHEFFGNEEYSERDAWGWLIEAAAWKPARSKINGSLVPIGRGQLSFSVRFMADKWGWSKSRVDRFLKRLAAEGMISTCSKIGTPNGAGAGHAQSVITICNYERYQAREHGNRDSSGTASGTAAGQQRDKEEEGKKERIEGRESPRERENLPENLDDAVPADLSDMQVLAAECARTAGTRQADAVQFGKDITLCREWTAAGADPPLMLDTIREGVAASARPIFSLAYFDQPIRTALAKRKALENGTSPRNPAAPVDEVTARAAARIAARRAASREGDLGLPG